MEPKNNGHTGTHVHPIERFVLTYDPNQQQLSYEFENMDYAAAIQRLALAQLYLFDNLKQAQAQAEQSENELANEL